MVVGQQKVFEMDLKLNNKKVLVTGASKGIGLAIAETFLAEGAKTCIVSRGSNDLFQNEKIFQKKYGEERIFALKCDFTIADSIDNLNNELQSKWGDLDIVIVNVGNGSSVPEPIPDDSSWQKSWNANFESALMTSRTFLPILKKTKGCLLFVSSIAGLEAFGAPTDYSTAKAAVIALAKNMARKIASENVRVNVLAPGNVYFKGGAWDLKIKEDDSKVNNFIKSSVPMGRFALPTEIADSAVFICSDRAKFITGATLVVDGGQTLSVF